MNLNDQPTLPLVSVIVPCYNHGRFLGNAIESILSQDYSQTEIIVIDDGSTDNTEHLAKSFPSVHYHNQPNQGLAAARNTGIELASGKYLVFLDADDILLPKAISTQVNFMKQNKEPAFVSGGHCTSDENLQNYQHVFAEVEKDHYLHLLQRNFIGMHAAVMYRRDIISQYMFDTAFKAVEDYDLYLRIAADHAVFHHTLPIAVYRAHSNNMSADLKLMLQHALKALHKQKPFLTDREKQEAYKKGVKNWIDFYSYHGYGILKKINSADKKLRKQFLDLLWTHKRRLYIKYHLRKIFFISKIF